MHEKYLYDTEFEDMKKYDSAGDFATLPADKKAYKKEAYHRLLVQRDKWKKKIDVDLYNYYVQLGSFFKALDKITWELYNTI